MAAEKFGRLPQALIDKPRLTASAAIYLELFYLLFCGSSIPLADIIIFCDLRGIEDREKTIIVLKQLEQIVIEYQNKKLRTTRDGKTRR